MELPLTRTATEIRLSVMEPLLIQIVMGTQAIPMGRLRTQTTMGIQAIPMGRLRTQTTMGIQPFQMGRLVSQMLTAIQLVIDTLGKLNLMFIPDNSS